MSGDTLPAQLLDRARHSPGRTAYRHKRLGVWEAGTWADYAADAAGIGLALEALGVAPGHRVAIVADNRPEWVVADLAAQGIGAVTVALRPGGSAGELSSVLSRCSVRVVVCEDEEQLDKVIESRAALPGLVAAVVIDIRSVRGLDDPLVRTWADLLTQGRALDPAAWRAHVETLDPDAAATIAVAVAGPGPPTVSELTSRSLISAGAALRKVMAATAADEVLSYLPLSHIGERLMTVIGALATGYVVNFGEGGRAFPQDLREVQPTRLLGTPLTWERMRVTTEHQLADASFVKRRISGWCFARGNGLALRRPRGSADLGLRLLCWLLCFRQVRRKLGLARVASALSAGAADPATLGWFGALGIQVQEGYGPALEAELGPLVGTLSPSAAADAVLA